MQLGGIRDGRRNGLCGWRGTCWGTWRGIFRDGEMSLFGKAFVDDLGELD